jgi:hypothetical protein
MRGDPRLDKLLASLGLTGLARGDNGEGGGVRGFTRSKVGPLQISPATASMFATA